MEFSSSAGNWKFSHIIYKRPLTKSCRPPRYTNESKHLIEVKEILKKYMEPSDSPSKTSDIIESSLTEIKKLTTQRKQRLNPNKYNLCEHETHIYDAMRIHTKSPVLRIRKSKSRALRIENNQSLRIQKLSYTKYPQTKKHFNLKPNSRQQNSGYSSYSDIYRGLLEKIPLKL